MRPMPVVTFAGWTIGLSAESRTICRGWGRIAIRKSLSFRPGEAENLVDAQIFGKRGPSGSPVHALGGALAIAAQRAPDHGGDRLGRMHTFGHQSEQPVARKAPKKFNSRQRAPVSPLVSSPRPMATLPKTGL
jgi:hypothetical protein